jgi:NADPH2:quinone reductase
LPDGISFPQGAAIGVPYATAYRALIQRGAAVRGETVLIHGASGGVGLAAVQLARSHGLRVLGTVGTERGRQLVGEQGADQVFDHRAPNYLDQIREATGGGGVNLILEMLANANLGKDLTLLAPRGRVVIIGSRGPVEIDPRNAMSRDADIRGMVLFNTPAADLADIHAALFAGLAVGDLRPIIGREFPLAKASEAHEAVMQPGAFGKIVLIP